MIQIAISQAALDPITATMLFGSVNYEAQTNAKGGKADLAGGALG
jgi:hypothetical protein